MSALHDTDVSVT